MSHDLMDGLTVSLVVAIASSIICPLLYWVLALPNRATADHA
ncbi:hypothetical protein [Oculatella sp. LEGE 06141]|nr:hypothetical protein [Oculatella sp. LEGE 06141]